MRGKVHRENMRKNGSARLAREEDYLHCGEIHDGRCTARCRIAVSCSNQHIHEKSARSDRIVFESDLNLGAKNRIDMYALGVLKGPSLGKDRVRGSSGRHLDLWGQPDGLAVVTIANRCPARVRGWVLSLFNFWSGQLKVINAWARYCSFAQRSGTLGGARAITHMRRRRPGGNARAVSEDGIAGW